MKKLKTLLCVLLTIAITLTLVSCGGGGSGTTTPSTPSSPSTTPEPATPSAPPVSTDAYVKYTIGVTDYLGRFLAGLTPTEGPAATDPVFDQVFKIDPKTKALISDCLTDWGWEDDNTFVMTLRPGVIFSNGAEATAEDLVYSYTSYLDRGSTGLNTMGLVWDECYARDKYTGVLKFEQPFRPFTNSTIHLICKEWAEEVGWDSMEWYQPVGSGPYECVEFSSEDLIRLKARDDWWGESLYGPVYVDEWEIKYYKDASTMYIDLEVGKLDFCEVQATDYGRYLRSGGDGFECFMLLNGVTQYFTFSFVDRPDLWYNKRLREAVAIGVRWEDLGVVAFNELFVPAKSVMPVAAPNFIDPGAYEYNPERAKEILAEEGFGPNNPLQLYTLMMDSQLYKALSENLQYQLQQIGINLELEFADIASAINVWNAPGNNDVGFWWNIRGSAAFDLYDGMPSALRVGASTFIHIPEDIPEFRSLWNRIVYTSDIEDANLAMKEMQQYCFDEIIYIPYLEMSGAFGYRTDRFTESQLRDYVHFVNMYQLGRLGLESAWN
ncbi:MAG: ABC transporter substrate-binding protein [Clostridiales bacterium]|nr:ABC transporter substrate-binding protein [Clostridiales bacterium]